LKLMLDVCSLSFLVAYSRSTHFAPKTSTNIDENTDEGKIGERIYLRFNWRQK
jgi:hypothetical protein